MGPYVDSKARKHAQERSCLLISALVDVITSEGEPFAIEIVIVSGGRRHNPDASLTRDDDYIFLQLFTVYVYKVECLLIAEPIGALYGS
jgi:hypothetical protein